MTPTDKAPKPGSDEALDPAERSILAYLDNKDPGRMSAERMMEIMESLVPASNVMAPQDELVETILEAYRCWVENATLRASNAKLKEALKQIAFTRKVGATPKLVPGSMIEKIERIALAALKETE